MIMSAQDSDIHGMRESRPRRFRLLNVEIDDITMEELLEKREGAILTLHVEMLAKLQKDEEFYRLLRAFDVVTCDSQILYFAAKALRTGIRERVSGSDYFPLFYTRWKDDSSVTIYLLGAMDDIAERAMRAINARVGREMVVGAYGPPSGFMDDPEEIERIIERVNESGATVLVAGLGAGRQERFLMRYRDRLTSAKLLLPLGGTIDYEAGAVKRPPSWITTLGLEWFWRLAREPRRRWRRYVLVQPPVVWQLIRQARSTYHDPFA
jgi:N-acetylglucosaminyldiphosphoundecaprenol N-acetyl-beta-D-mannosaminyltransferase